MSEQAALMQALPPPKALIAEDVSCQQYNIHWMQIFESVVPIPGTGILFELNKAKEE